MSHRLDNLNEHDKRRLLIILTTLSIAIIIVLWGLYINRTLHSPNEQPTVSASNVFKAGLAVIREKIEAGFVNSFLYFRDALSEKILTIEKP